MTRSSPFEVSTSEMKTNKKKHLHSTERKSRNKEKIQMAIMNWITTFCLFRSGVFYRFVMAAKVRNKTQWYWINDNEKETKKSLIVWFNLLQRSLPFPKPHGSFILSKSGQQSPALSQNSSQKHNALLTKSSIPQLVFRPLQQSTDPPSSLLSQHCTDPPSSFCKQTLLAKVVMLNAMVMANTKERCFANSIAARPTRIVTVHLLPDVWNGITAPVLFTIRSEESRGRKDQMFG